MIAQNPAPGFTGIGQEVPRAIVTRAADRDRLQRTLLVHGPAGSGKGAFVDDLLALLLCSDPSADRRPCNACRACRDARSRAHPDLVVGGPLAWREWRSAGESIVAAARRWLLAASGAPISAARRVVLIEHADRANEQTQNALLKALEEPAARQMFVLTADDAERLLPTIRSRCQPLRMGPVPRDELVAALMERERLPADQASAIARLADGLSGRAFELARSPDRVAWRRRTEQHLLDLLGRGRAERFASVRDLLDEAAPMAIAGDPQAPDEEVADAARTATAVQRQAALLVLDAWLGLARDLMVVASRRPELATSGELHPELTMFGPRLGVGPVARCVQVLERIRSALEINAAPRLAMEVAMLAWPTLEADR